MNIYNEEIIIKFANCTLTYRCSISYRDLNILFFLSNIDNSF